MKKGIIKYFNEYQYDEILFHHRLPTSTPNTLKTTHPFVCEIDSKKYYFIHNGVIQNADKLKKQHEKKGIAYSSEKNGNFNDSEALAWDFCLWLNKKQKNIEAKGSVAFICLETDKQTNQAEKLYFYRNNASPLQIYKDKTLFLIASEGNYASVKKNWVYFWDYQKRQVRKDKFLEIQSPELFSLYNYDYAFVDEIDDEEDEFDLIRIKDDIRTLEQERDYLVSIGGYVEAEIIDEEIDELKDQMREARKLLSPLI